MLTYKSMGKIMLSWKPEMQFVVVTDKKTITCMQREIIIRTNVGKNSLKTWK